MRFRIEKRDSLVLLRIDEKHATWGAGADEVKQALLGLIEEGHTRVVIDMSRVEFADSSMLGALIAGLKLVTRKGGAMSIIGANERIRTIFQQTRLHRVFAIYDTEEDALASL